MKAASILLIFLLMGCASIESEFTTTEENPRSLTLSTDDLDLNHVIQYETARAFIYVSEENLKNYISELPNQKWECLEILKDQLKEGRKVIKEDDEICDLEGFQIIGWLLSSGEAQVYNKEKESFESEVIVTDFSYTSKKHWAGHSGKKFYFKSSKTEFFELVELQA